MDPGKERFLRNYNVLKQFAADGSTPNKNFWDFMNAIADLFYNFRREKIVQAVKSNSVCFKKFMWKNVQNKNRHKIFHTIKKTIRAVLIHLLNTKIFSKSIGD